MLTYFRIRIINCIHQQILSNRGMRHMLDVYQGLVNGEIKSSHGRSRNSMKPVK